jgi:long-subunit fatty acid transport protein
MKRIPSFPQNSIKLVILLSFLYGGFLSAQNAADAINIFDNEIGFGARAVGMGGAYTAIAEDYSAIYWNPAGLAQIRKTELWLGLSHLYLNNDINFNGSNSSSSISATKFNSFGLVFPVPTYQGSMVFALGYQKVKDFDYMNEYMGISNKGSSSLTFYSDPNNPDSTYDFWGRDVQKQGLVTDDGSLNQWSFAGAIDVSPNISVGLSMNYWTGKSEYSREFDQQDIFNNFQTFPADFDQYLETGYITTEYSSFNVKFGGMLKLGKIIRVGVGIDVPQTITAKEDWGKEGILYFDNNDELDVSDEGIYEYEVKIPFRFQTGAALKLGPILGTGSLEYTDWTQFKFETNELKTENSALKNDYRGTVTVKLGGELNVAFLASQFRAGLIYEPTPLKGYDFDYDRKFASIGYGVLLDRIFKIDLAYMLGVWKQFTADDLNPGGTEEDIFYNKLLATFSYRF